MRRQLDPYHRRRFRIVAISCFSLCHLRLDHRSLLHDQKTEFETKKILGCCITGLFYGMGNFALLWRFVTDADCRSGRDTVQFSDIRARVFGNSVSNENRSLANFSRHHRFYWRSVGVETEPGQYRNLDFAPDVRWNLLRSRTTRDAPSLFGREYDCRHDGLFSHDRILQSVDAGYTLSLIHISEPTRPY